MSWSRHGYENASYCISHTGRQPAMQSPTAVPRMPASASGVSTQRSGPNRSRRPAVARKTPPARPTSSPITMTASSRSSSTRSASFTASTIKSSAKVGPEHAAQLGEIGGEALRWARVRVLEEQGHVGFGLGLGSRDPSAHRIGGLRANGRLEVVAENPEPAQVALVAAETLVPLLILDAFELDVRPPV